MDPITKALERAQRDESSVRQWVQPDSDHEVEKATAEETKQKTSATPETQAGENPRIDNTSIIHLDPELLASNHLLCGTEREIPLITDRYRILRTRVLQLMRANGWRSLGITSPGAKAGKTVTSINLAISIARENKDSVTLLDADIRRPTAAEYLGASEPTAGLPDYLLGQATLTDVIWGIDSLKTLSFVSGKSAHQENVNPDILKSSRVAKLLSEIQTDDESSLLIVDLPPVLVGDDVLAMAAHLDALLFVVDENSTHVDDLKNALELVEDFNLVGTVMNKSTSRQTNDSGYHYHYRNDMPAAAPDPKAENI